MDQLGSPQDRRAPTDEGTHVDSAWRIIGRAVLLLLATTVALTVAIGAALLGGPL